MRVLNFLFGWINWFWNPPATREEPPTEKRRWLSNEELKQRRAICAFPRKRMTAAEFKALPKGAAVTEEFLETCPFHTWFACTPSDLAPELTVVGHVVPGNELICSQYGAGLCVPRRGINRYILQIRD